MSDSSSIPPEIREALYNEPGFPPPDGITPNFDNPSNDNTLGLCAVIICLVLATLAVVLRGISRLFYTKRLELEDYLGIIAYGFYIGCVWTVLEIARTIGLFVHQWDIRALDLVHFSYVAHVLQVVYCFTMLFAKTAILLEWNRIFAPRGIRNSFFWVSHAIMLVNALLYASAIIALNLACRPLEKLWHFWLPGICNDRRALDICTSSFNLIFDLCILFLPQRSIWHLQMSNKRKIGVSLIFSVGILALCGAAGRVYETANTDYKGERTYGAASIALFGIMETTCVILIFCVPAIPKIFTESSYWSQFSTYLLSWKRLTRSSRKDSLEGSSRWNGATSKPAPSKTYERIDEQKHISLANLEHHVTPLPTSQHYTSQNNYRHNENGILRVTEFSSTETSSGNPQATQLYGQHPWMDEGSNI
ncbi:hypothetical protein F4810DRAFT_671807 [Camillea tinctor]|nr:hypothetical protein F4810DRAFT_671807 [Camillea tinctor]